MDLESRHKIRSVKSSVGEQSWHQASGLESLEFGLKCRLGVRSLNEESRIRSSGLGISTCSSDLQSGVWTCILYLEFKLESGVCNLESGLGSLDLESGAQTWSLDLESGLGVWTWESGLGSLDLEVWTWKSGLFRNVFAQKCINFMEFDGWAESCATICLLVLFMFLRQGSEPAVDYLIRSCMGHS